MAWLNPGDRRAIAYDDPEVWERVRARAAVAVRYAGSGRYLLSAQSATDRKSGRELAAFVTLTRRWRASRIANPMKHCFAAGWMTGRGIRAHRGNSLFATGDRGQAHEWLGAGRALYAILPADDAQLTFSTVHQDLAQDLLCDDDFDPLELAGQLELAGLVAGPAGSLLEQAIASCHEVLLSGVVFAVRHNLQGWTDRTEPAGNQGTNPAG